MPNPAVLFRKPNPEAIPCFDRFAIVLATMNQPTPTTPARARAWKTIARTRASCHAGGRPGGSGTGSGSRAPVTRGSTGHARAGRACP
jgi:hypothetical protein